MAMRWNLIDHPENVSVVDTATAVAKSEEVFEK